MADPPPDADPRPHIRPRWVKVLGIVALVVVLLVVVMMVAGGGQHGPRRHTGASTPAVRTVLSGGHAARAGSAFAS